MLRFGGGFTVSYLFRQCALIVLNIYIKSLALQRMCGIRSTFHPAYAIMS